MRVYVVAAAILVLSACSTQRYGRQTELSATERQYLDCKDIKIEKAKTEEFLSDVRMQRNKTSGMHVLGALGDFGVGNAMEGDAAELSGEKRLKGLRDLETQKECK